MQDLRDGDVVPSGLLIGFEKRQGERRDCD